MAHFKLFSVAVFLLLATGSQASGAARCGSELQQEILNLIFKNYDNRVRPPPGIDATLVTVNSEILNVVSVDEKAHQWRVELYLRMQWNDPRLAYSAMVHSCPKIPYISLSTPEAVNSIWRPMLERTAELGRDAKVNDVLERNVGVRISPNGDIYYSVHIDTLLYCTGQGSKPGEFVCPFVNQPYFSQNFEILLQWKAQDPVQIDRSQILLPDHIVGNIDTSATTVTSATGSYSALVANFHFLRKACLQ